MLVLKDLQESIYSDDFDTALLTTSEMLRVLYIEPKNINNWGVTMAMSKQREIDLDKKCYRIVKVIKLGKIELFTIRLGRK